MATGQHVRGDAALYRRVERRIPELARRMVATFVEEIPLYARLPKEQLDGEVSQITAENLRVFFRTLRERRPPTYAELADMRLSAARRAEERVPLDVVLTAYHIGGRIGWQALVESAEPEESDILIAAADRVLGYVQRVVAAVSAAYLEERQAIYGEERDARRSFAQALLAGEPADAAAARLGISVAPCYIAVAWRFPTLADERDDSVAGAIAARRKVRRAQAQLDEFAGQPVVGLLEAAGGITLVPATPETVEKVAAGLHTVATRVGDAVRAPVHAAAAICRDVTGLAMTATEARDVLRVVERLGRPPGLYSLRDVLLEYQLSRDSAALPRLAALLDPLARNPDLLLTVETALAHDLDRRRTAAVLHVHPNTLDYRLRRVTELTGCDLSSSRGVQLLGAAVAARRLCR